MTLCSSSRFGLVCTPAIGKSRLTFEGSRPFVGSIENTAQQVGDRLVLFERMSERYVPVYRVNIAATNLLDRQYFGLSEIPHDADRSSLSDAHLQRHLAQSRIRGDGQAEQYVHLSAWEGKNLRIETLVSAAKAEAIIAVLAEKYLDKFGLVVFAAEVQVYRSARFE